VLLPESGQRRFPSTSGGRRRRYQRSDRCEIGFSFPESVGAQSRGGVEESVLVESSCKGQEAHDGGEKD
jgi:hypothetical protein